MISKHEKAYEARGAKTRQLYIAFECFDMGMQTRTQVFDMTSHTYAQELNGKLEFSLEGR